MRHSRAAGAERRGYAVAALLLLAVTSMNCSDSVAPAPPATRTVTLAGTAVTPANVSLVAARISTMSTRIWPAPDGGAIQFYEAYTDSAGHFVLPLGVFAATSQLDSLDVSLDRATCAWPPPSRTVRLTAVPLDDRAADTVPVTLRSATPWPAGHFAVGQLCAPGAIGTGEHVTSFDFTLWIDEIADSVRGRYRVVYQASAGDDWGHLSGVQQGSELVLTLTPANTGSCAPLLLRIGLEASGELGLAHWGPSTCTETLHFRFSPDSTHAWRG